ncbi:TrmH family RNA methyltransferase [Antrihabitans cavernicola]|uniref:RNA methyltransferase n=1 Tax=Antrihabitans cavernicola TaxID=2495913 RepID=A0A5A7SB29_9NOCA|nr:TrmH family RNA methyltransferase [Spelaeibacter cavernicola]KAA0023350.1 RNA methyltransferase [Spelaeibacter cavernicola]
MNKKVTSRNAAFQQWQSYLTNRSKRTKAGRFLIQGVRPITLATEHDWPIEAMLYRDGGGALSTWARDLLDRSRAEQIALSPELIAELGEKSDVVPEVIAVAKARTPELRAWRPVGTAPVIVVFDRPASPGNLGTLIRSANAFGAEAVVVAGHGADQFDPQSVRASTGSVFAIPVFRIADVGEMVAFRDQARRPSTDLTIVGTDEDGTAAIFDHDFTGGTVLVVGNETRGMSVAWREACDVVVQIPIGGAASSLGAPSAGAVCLYEIARQRG